MEDSDLVRRFDYHPPSKDGVARTHEQVRAAALTFARTMNELLPDGREKSLVMTHAEDAMFWANAAVAREQHAAGG